MKKLFPITFCIAACSALLGSSACTFNVSGIDHEISATSSSPLSRLEIDLVPVEPRIGRAGLVIAAAGDSDARATARLVGLEGSGADLEALLLSWSIGLSAREAGTLGVDLGAPESSTGVWLEELTVEVPTAVDVSVALEAISMDASGLSGRLDAISTSGSMVVESSGVVDLETSSGSIVVEAEAGAMHTTSGNIRVDLDGWITTSTTSGSIAGVVGDGGSAESTSGSIHLTLLRALSRDFTLSTTSGSVVVEVPRGAPMRLDLVTESGGVAVNVTGVDYGGTTYVGDVSGGGPLLRIRSSSGSIHVREAP